MSYASSNPGTASAVARRSKWPNMRAELRGAILVEQLWYLFEHAGSCPADCPDCARLRTVEQILLQPFNVGTLTSAEPTLLSTPRQP